MTATPAEIAALRAADVALRNHACHGGAKAPCIRTPDQCREDCGREAGDALILVEAALKSVAYPTGICTNCGNRYGRRRAGISTFYPGFCGWCGGITFVTEPRDYCHPPAPKGQP